MLVRPVCSCSLAIHCSWISTVDHSDTVSSSAPVLVLSAHQDLLFFARCLAPLARLVASSAPAAAAWYDLVNAKALPGTGLPRHPWVGGGPDGSGDAVPSCCPEPRSTDAACGAPGAEESGGRNGEARGQDPGPTADHVEREEEEDDEEDEEEEEVEKDEAELYLAISSAADSDEWSARLIGAGLVRSLVNSLQACLDFRAAARGLGAKTAPAAAVRGPSSSARGGGGPAGRDGLESVPGDASGNGRSHQERKYHRVCFGCELETVHVSVMMALGALLSAHPLAARDRFQLAGGPLRVHRAIFQQPKDHLARDEELLHTCAVSSSPSSSRGGDGPRSGAAAPLPRSPFLREHCALVAVQVLRLSLRAGGAEPNGPPPDVLEGAARLVGALSSSMLSAWVALADCSPRSRGGAPGEESICGRRRVLSQKFLPLGLPGEVSLPVAWEASGVVDCGSASAEASFSGRQGSSAIGIKLPLDSSSYRLCG